MKSTPSLVVMLPKNSWLPVCLALLTLFPLLAIASYLMPALAGKWQFTESIQLTEYTLNSLLLMFGVGLNVLVIGVACAWFISFYDFVGRRWLEWLLIFPLAFPTYILAATYNDFLQFTGILQSTLRQITGWEFHEYWFPAIRSTEGAIFILSIAFYPYVYIAARAVFVKQSNASFAISRTLGCTPWQLFWRVALPIARPAIIASTAFAMIESVADFGAVSSLSVNTFTTGIYFSWYSIGNPNLTAQLCSLLLLLVYLLLFLAYWNEGNLHYQSPYRAHHTLSRVHLTGINALLVSLICILPVIIGFILPLLLLFHQISDTEQWLSLNHLVKLTLNSISLALASTVLLITTSLIILYSSYHDKRYFTSISLRLSLSGHTIPSIVIAIGLLMFLGKIDQIVANMQAVFSWNFTFFLSSSLLALLYGCSNHFFAIAYRPLASNLKNIHYHYEESAQTLGASASRIFWQIHLPLLRSHLIGAALLVFVEVIKELPITLILRPFSFNTLAIETYHLANTDRLHSSALPALLIVIIGLLPVILLCRAMTAERPEQRVNSISL